MLDVALAKYEKGRMEEAVLQLKALLREISAQSGKSVPEETATALTQKVETLIATISESP